MKLNEILANEMLLEQNEPIAAAAAATMDTTTTTTTSSSSSSSSPSTKTKNQKQKSTTILDATLSSPPQPQPQPLPVKRQPYKLVWRNIFALTLLHLFTIYASTYVRYAKVATILWTYFIGLISGFGVIAGAHRLWSHRSYKANTGVRLVLSLLHAMALQNDLYEWCRDHRVHHKFSETDADPHDARKGFFFSHVGWLMVKKHPEVIRRGKTVDLSDLEADPIVMFQRQFYIPLVIIFWALIPTAVPCICWHENLVIAFMCTVIFRYVLLLNITWLVNSWAHWYGARPYNEKIGATEVSCLIRYLMLGDGYHNYHHTFPWDYSSSEFGSWDVFNPATVLIDFFHYMGWAWDLKQVPPEMIKRRIERIGNEKVHDEYVKVRRSVTPLREQINGVFAIISIPIIVLIYNLLFG